MDFRYVLNIIDYDLLLLKHTKKVTRTLTDDLAEGQQSKVTSGFP